MIDDIPEEKYEDVSDSLLKVVTGPNMNENMTNHSYRIGSKNRTNHQRKNIVKFIRHKETITFPKARKIIRKCLTSNQIEMMFLQFIFEKN